jgi:hypothetical protein
MLSLTFFFFFGIRHGQVPLHSVTHANAAEDEDVGLLRCHPPPSYALNFTPKNFVIALFSLFLDSSASFGLSFQ